jgi:hypothetical protein
MLYHEFNMDKALAVSREEGREEGEVRGMEKGREGVFSLLRKGYSVDEAEKMLVTREAGIRA